MTDKLQIPDEYKMFDYGFSAVADPTENLPTPPEPVISPEVQEEFTDKLQLIDEKLEMLLRIVSSSSEDAKLSLTEVEYRDKIRTLEQIIVPLLNNLLKTSDKAYIHWPNRGPVIEEQLKKVLAITRGT